MMPSRLIGPDNDDQDLRVQVASTFSVKVAYLRDDARREWLVMNSATAAKHRSNDLQRYSHRLRRLRELGYSH